MATAAPITGAPVRASLIPVPLLGNEPHLHLKAPPPRVANRRDLLCFAGAATALGAAVATGAVALASEAIAAPTLFGRALARYEAADAHYESLTGLSKAEFDVAEAAYLNEFDAMVELRPTNPREFMALFIVAARCGQLDPDNRLCEVMVATAKRLTGAA